MSTCPHVSWPFCFIHMVHWCRVNSFGTQELKQRVSNLQKASRRRVPRTGGTYKESKESRNKTKWHWNWHSENHMLFAKAPKHLKTTEGISYDFIGKEWGDMICPCPERAISNKLQQPQPTQPPYSSTALEACLGLEGENRQLREQIAELEKTAAAERDSEGADFIALHCHLR